MLIATENLSRSEKLRIIEQLWDELSRDPGSVESPAWHADALREAETRVANGEAKFPQTRGQTRYWPSAYSTPNHRPFQSKAGHCFRWLPPVRSGRSQRDLAATAQARYANQDGRVAIRRYLACGKSTPDPA